MKGGPAVVGSGAPPARPSAAHMVCWMGMPAAWLAEPKFGQQPAGRPVPLIGLPLASRTAVARPMNKLILVIGVMVVHSGTSDPAAGWTAGTILTSVFVLPSGVTTVGSA